MSDDFPTLADLRRKSPRRAPRSSAPPTTPSLFDTPAPPPTPAPKPLIPSPLSLIPAPQDRIFTVTELIGNLRSLVERTYAHITVQGEISNWRPSASGHCYFTLKDGAAQLSVVLFRRQAQLLRFKPKDGDAVRIRGQLSVYDARGQLQLIAESMQQTGLGALLAAVQELKARLRREGLFDNARPLPQFPRCIGIVTSLQGAALRDIVKVCRRRLGVPDARSLRGGVSRHASVNLLIYPAAVQGPNCPSEIAAGITWFSRHAAPKPGWPIHGQHLAHEWGTSEPQPTTTHPTTDPGCPIHDAVSSRHEWETREPHPTTDPGCPIHDAVSSRHEWETREAHPTTDPGCPIHDAVSSRHEWETREAHPTTDPGCPVHDGSIVMSGATTEVDVVLVTRGGGSWEDLHGFDHELVVRAIAACSIPVITGIGHATDTVLADSAADLCAPTPSAAAELLTAGHFGLEASLARLHSRLLRATRYELLRTHQRLLSLTADAILRRARSTLARRSQRLDDLTTRAHTALEANLRRRNQQLARLTARLSRRDPALRLSEDRRRLGTLQSRLSAARIPAFSGANRRLARATAQLDTLSPLRVLERGYALVYGPDGRLLRNATDAPPNTPITAQLARGRLRATVTE